MWALYFWMVGGDAFVLHSVGWRRGIAFITVKRPVMIPAVGVFTYAASWTRLSEGVFWSPSRSSLKYEQILPFSLPMIPLDYCECVCTGMRSMLFRVHISINALLLTFSSQLHPSENWWLFFQGFFTYHGYFRSFSGMIYIMKLIASSQVYLVPLEVTLYVYTAGLGPATEFGRGGVATFHFQILRVSLMRIFVHSSHR